MNGNRRLTPEMQALVDARNAETMPLPISALDAFLASLDELFHPDRVNAHLWHCRTKEEFDEERDRLRDDEDEAHAQPDLDGGNDTWFTDRN